MTPELWVTIIVALISASLGGGLMRWITFPTTKKAAEVDLQTAKVDLQAKIQAVYGGIIDELREDLAEQEGRIDSLERERKSNLAKIEAQEKRIVVLEKERDVNLAKIKIQDERIAQLERQLAVEIGKVAALTESNENLLKRIDTLEEENELLREGRKAI